MPLKIGLGDLTLIQRERAQGKAGRLDLLLSDPDQGRRYEVELMLGATDASHVIRTIERDPQHSRSGGESGGLSARLHRG